jgi:hypothetical protein
MLVSTIRIKASAAVKEVILRIFTSISFSQLGSRSSKVSTLPIQQGRYNGGVMEVCQVTS